MTFTQIKETSLYVKNLEQAEAFYNKKLGFEIITKSENRHVFFRAGASVLLCFIAETTAKDTKLPPHAASGKIHIAFEVKKEEYEKVKSDLKEKGIELIQEQDWPGGLKSVYFRDPDGHLLEVVPEGLWG